MKRLKNRNCNIVSIILSIFLLLCTMACGHTDTDSHVESEETEHAHEGDLQIDLEKARKFGIESTLIEKCPFAEVIKVSGLIEPSATSIMTVTAKKSGIITLSPGITQGIEVKRGASIGSISSTGMEGGDVNAAAKANLESAKKELDRLENLLKEGLTTRAEINEAERNYKEKLALASSVRGGNVTEISPGDGVILSLNVTSGQYVEAGTPIAVVGKNTQLTLRADVPQRYSTFIPFINNANFKTAGSETVYSIKELNGKQINTGNYIAQEGFIPLYFTFTGNGNIIPGSFVEIYLIGETGSEVISVPEEALIELQGNFYVYVVTDGDDYEKRSVKTGMSDGSSVEITDGLEPGEVVVTKGALTVRMMETSAIAPPEHTHNH